MLKINKTSLNKLLVGYNHKEYTVWGLENKKVKGWEETVTTKKEAVEIILRHQLSNQIIMLGSSETNVNFEFTSTTFGPNRSLLVYAKKREVNENTYNILKSTVLDVSQQPLNDTFKERILTARRLEKGGE